MLFQIKAYLKFLLASTNEHGVHSPFVFDLVTKCLYDDTRYPEYESLSTFRASLLADKNFITVTDFGAGSKVFTSNLRQVSKIAGTAGISRYRAEMLFRIARYFKPESILEIGTSLGLATAALSLGNPMSKITTLEGCGETAKTAKAYFNKFGLTNIDAKITPFDTFLSSLHPTSSRPIIGTGTETKTYQLIYFDGNHQKEATLKYFELLLHTRLEDSIWIFDDIHWSGEMNDAWKTIKRNPAVTVSIDTFQWGILFFRQAQEKESFTIRP